MEHDIKRMLELAAKAVGYEVDWNEHWKGYQRRNPKPDSNGQYRHTWAPHLADGDCMVLITSLGLLVDVDWKARTVTAVLPDRVEMIHTIVHVVNIPEGSDGMAETRLAVLMAAAAIGEAMP